MNRRTSTTACPSSSWAAPWWACPPPCSWAGSASAICWSRSTRAPRIHPRGRGNNVRTMELFRTAGVEPQIREAASVLADNHGILQAAVA